MNNVTTLTGANLELQLIKLAERLKNIATHSSLTQLAQIVGHWSDGSMTGTECLKLAAAIKLGCPLVCAFELATGDVLTRSKVASVPIIFWTTVLNDTDKIYLFVDELRLLRSILIGERTPRERVNTLYMMYINAGDDWRRATLNRMDHLERSGIMKEERMEG